MKLLLKDLTGIFFNCNLTDELKCLLGGKKILSRLVRFWARCSFVPFKIHLCLLKIILSSYSSHISNYQFNVSEWCFKLMQLKANEKQTKQANLRCTSDCNCITRTLERFSQDLKITISYGNMQGLDKVCEEVSKMQFGFHWSQDQGCPTH